MSPRAPELPRSITDLDTPVPKRVLQSRKKAGTKWEMATVPVVLATLFAAISIPLVWTASQSIDQSVFSQKTEQSSTAATEETTSRPVVVSPSFALISTLDGVGYPPVPSLDAAVSDVEQRELVAHFAQNRGNNPLRGAAPEESSSSAEDAKTRQRVRIQDLKFPEPPVPPEDPKKAVKQYGVYLTAGSMGREDFVEETMQDLVKRGASALVFDIKGSFIYFPTTQTPLATEWDMVRPIFDLKAIVDRAHELNLYVIGRYIAVKDPVLAEIKPELALRHPKNNSNLQTQWVEPSNETVHEYNRQIIKDAAMTGIDEINLDYIRYPTSLPQTLAAIPTEVKSDRIGSFIKMAREAIDEAGTDTKLGISSYAILGWNYEANLPGLGQDVVQFAPLLDVISPMAYPSTFSEAGYGSAPNGRSRDYWLVYRTLTGYKELLGPDHDWKLRPWIQAYYKNAKNVRDEIDGVIDAGACGFTMWSAANDYGQSYAAFDNWKQPEHCKVTD